MAVACLVSWIVVPIVKLWKYLATSPSLERCRSRAIGVTIGIAAAIILILEVIPFPNHFRASGILEARERAEVVNDVSGYMEKLMVEPGARVTNGQPLLVLRNPELELDFQAANARFREATAIRLMALQQTNSANLKPADRRLESVRQQLERLERDREALVVRAREEGVWVAPEVKDYLGRWVPRGADFGLVINAGTYIFKATVPQTDVSSLFDKEVRSATIRIHGEAGSRIEVSNIKVIQAGQRRLPSAALGYMAGGDMAVSHTDPEGRQTTEPFFEVLAEVKPGAATMLLDGRSGKIRFRLPPEPLLHQWFRRLRQLLQQRYQW